MSRQRLQFFPVKILSVVFAGEGLNHGYHGYNASGLTSSIILPTLRLLRNSIGRASRKRRTHGDSRAHRKPGESDDAEGLVVRHDQGAQSMSGHFQRERHFLGIEASPSFVQAPQRNGVAERFVRTLKEQLRWE